MSDNITNCVNKNLLNSKYIIFADENEEAAEEEPDCE